MEDVGNIETTNNLQSIAETLHQSPKKKKYACVFASLFDGEQISGSPTKKTVENSSSMIEFFTSNFSSIHAKEKFCVNSASERTTSTPEIRKNGNLTGGSTKAIDQNANSITNKADFASISYKAMPQEKIDSTLPGQVKQVTRGRGRGRRALWKENDALPSGMGRGILCASVNTASMKTRKSHRHESTPTTLGSTNTAKRSSPMKNALATPIRKSPRRKFPHHESSPSTTLGSNTAKRSSPMKNALATPIRKSPRRMFPHSSPSTTLGSNTTQHSWTLLYDTAQKERKS
jgi:hypothetical protein